MVYDFGNRPAARGEPHSHPEPGPINQMLADAVLQVAQHCGGPVYAQWEIAKLLKGKHPDVSAIEPVVAADGTVTYLSTDGVAQAVVALANRPGARKLGTVCVVAHRDHSKRCVATSKARGMDAAVAAEVALPAAYDAESGQPWTRRRDLYLLHDMAARWMQLRADRIAAAYPQG
ncbi:hypothetical protein [Acidipila sp. EB88]|uniref:hypothetical protein n=1 Tax=Acidipila sp. EB88 TaxID=2305226 RepID=UPI0018F4442B|nr:hypothetical protein [Acidipila sp. EB88]